MTVYKIRLPKTIADTLAVLGMGLTFAGGLIYSDYNDRLNDELRYAGANVETVPYRIDVPWSNFVNEGGGTAHDWALHQEKLKEINGGRNITKFRFNEPFKAFDLKDPKTGKPNGKVLPDSYGK